MSPDTAGRFLTTEPSGKLHGGFLTSPSTAAFLFFFKDGLLCELFSLLFFET